jgi:hypothetical protein
MAKLKKKRNTDKAKAKSKPISNFTPLVSLLNFQTSGMQMNGVTNIKYQHISPIKSILNLF